MFFLPIKKLVWVFLMILFTLSCTRKIRTPQTVKNFTKLSLISLKTENLSEEITGNDEICWMVWLIKDTIPTPFIMAKMKDTLSFNQKELHIPKKLTFEQSFNSLQNATLIIVLAENDTDRLPLNRFSLVEKELQKLNYQPHDSLQARLYQALLDDDLLGISFSRLSSLQNRPEGSLLFSGIHLFDKYHYILQYKLE